MACTKCGGKKIKTNVSIKKQITAPKQTNTPFILKGDTTKKIYIPRNA